MGVGCGLELRGIKGRTPRSVLKIDHFDRDSNSNIKNGSKNMQMDSSKRKLWGEGTYQIERGEKPVKKKVSQGNAEWGKC